MAFFEHDGCALHYEEYGQGEPLLLVHGLGSSAPDWEYQVPELAPHYRVIVVDLRGHGRSDKPHERYSIEGFAADLAALLERLGTGPVHYVGLSMGGMTGFQMGVDYPALLKSLTIVNAAPEVKLRKPDDYWQWFKRWSLMHLVSMGAIGKGLGGKLFPLPEQAELRRKISERWAHNDKRAYIASFNAIVGWGVQERIGQIRCPTLIISADRDYTPVALKEQYIKLMPNAKLAVIANSRHATPLDQPELFNRTLKDFLATVSSTPKDQRVPC